MKFDIQNFLDDCHDIILELRLQNAEIVRIEVTPKLMKKIKAHDKGMAHIDGIEIVEVEGMADGYAYAVITARNDGVK